MSSKTTNFSTERPDPPPVIKRYTDPDEYTGLKIIHAGFHRTGSSSLSVALDMLGFGPCWHAKTTPTTYLDKFEAGMKWWIDNKILQKLNKNQPVDFQEWVDTIKCTTIMDFPCNFHWDKLYKQYPDCKVILGVRDYDKWYRSNNYLVHTFTTKSFVFRYIGTLVDPLLRMVAFDYYGAYYKEGIPFLLDPKNKETVRERYFDGVIKKIKQRVPEENLLLYSIKDGWEPLCKFLGVDVPKDTPFPRVNEQNRLDLILERANKQSLNTFGKLMMRPIVVAIVLGLIGYKYEIFPNFFSYFLTCLFGLVVFVWYLRLNAM